MKGQEFPWSIFNEEAAIERALLNVIAQRGSGPDRVVVTLDDELLCAMLGVSRHRLAQARAKLEKHNLVTVLHYGRRGSGMYTYLPRGGMSATKAKATE